MSEHPRQLKPGSVLADGSVVDHMRNISERGPCFVPRVMCRSLGRHTNRLKILFMYGWHYAPAKDWPGFAPTGDFICIRRD